MQSPVAPEAWVEYIGSDPADLTPQGARGVVMQSAPNEGGYLVNFEGTGGGFYSEGAFRTIATPTFDPRESVWVSIEQGEWVVRVGGYSGERAGSFSELHEAIAFGRAIAVDEARELAWLSADGRRIDRESPSAG